MADFDDLDEETLERLRKALAKRSESGTGLDPWQEHFDRGQSTFSEQVLSNDIIQGLSGSWAASYDFGWGSGTAGGGGAGSQAQDAAIPTTTRPRTSKFGRRGVPDLDFVPYNWRTNRFSVKGPALVGNPISFEPFGPTLKSDAMDWTWEVVPGGGPNGGDLLTQAPRPDGGAATALTIEEMWNTSPWAIGDVGEPNGGLYLMVTDYGEMDGSLDLATAPSMKPLAAHADTARTEIFRVIGLFNVIDGPYAPHSARIELHPNKPLTSYFDLPANRSVRGVTLFTPYASRLAAIPESGAGVGRERVFQVVSPTEAAASDYYPPYDGGTPGDGTWLQGGFPSHDGVSPAGTSATWMGKATLPIPTPIRETQGFVEKLPFIGVPSAASAGTSLIQGVVAPDPTDVGRILRVYHVDRPSTATFNNGGALKILGWFEVLGVSGNDYTVRHVPDVPPLTGQVFHGQVTMVDAGFSVIALPFTVHDPVSEIFQGDFSYDKVEAVRLQNLIDPAIVERFAKKRLSSTTPQSSGASPGRADRAAVGTISVAGGAAPGFQSEDPGNLLDLGFRMVLYPAKQDLSGAPIPDFDQPIDSVEAIIDPTLAVKQYIEVDYSNGVVTLSHSPPDARFATDSQITPNGLVLGPDNPRGEVILYAACVPYSREPQSNAPGIRAAVHDPDGNGEHVDVFSNRITATIDFFNTSFLGGAPWIDEATGLVLTTTWGGPQTGIVELLDGGIGSPSIGRWSYSKVESFAAGQDTLKLVASLSGSASPAAFGPTMTVVLRREVRTVVTASLDNSFAIDDYRFDTTYGSTARFNTLRFGSTITPFIDGSAQITSGGGGVGRIRWDEVLGFGPNTNAHNGYISLLDGLFWDTSEATPLAAPDVAPTPQSPLHGGPLYGKFTRTGIVGPVDGLTWANIGAAIYTWGPSADGPRNQIIVQARASRKGFGLAGVTNIAILEEVWEYAFGGWSQVETISATVQSAVFRFSTSGASIFLQAIDHADFPNAVEAVVEYFAVTGYPAV
jgi:hypothetical protein